MLSKPHMGCPVASSDADHYTVERRLVPFHLSLSRYSSSKIVSCSTRTLLTVFHHLGNRRCISFRNIVHVVADNINRFVFRGTKILVHWNPTASLFFQSIRCRFCYRAALDSRHPDDCSDASFFLLIIALKHNGVFGNPGYKGIHTELNAHLIQPFCNFCRLLFRHIGNRSAQAIHIDHGHFFSVDFKFFTENRYVFCQLAHHFYSGKACTYHIKCEHPPAFFLICFSSRSAERIQNVIFEQNGIFIRPKLKSILVYTGNSVCSRFGTCSHHQIIILVRSLFSFYKL